MYRFGILMIIASILAFGYPENVEAYTFLRSLRLGDSGGDVKELQKALNADPVTRITAAGSGAPGQETNYFGSLTQKAVIKFQEKYKTDILNPARLSLGNGYVGPLTVKKLNTIQIQGPLVLNPNNTAVNNDILAEFRVNDSEKIDIYATDKKIQGIHDSWIQKINNVLATKNGAAAINTNELLPQNLSPVLLTQISQQSASPGTIITLSGIGFNSENTLYFGSQYVLRGIKGQNGVLSISVPSLPYGKYDLVIKNSQGTSNSLVFIITSKSPTPVIVSSVSPQRISYGQTITLNGSGFSPTGNDIYTTFGTIKGVSSADGKSLTVTFQPEYLREIIKTAPGGTQYGVLVTVVNDNGYTASPALFNLTTP
ncbi:IPT/TIG domain-containing protein [Candidatus Parcubacteria bacterium]|nr:IPT/TIG domain-containing protein [Candidatus Parcubacteria bacterium]